jgi:hypothetical protein
LYSFFQINMQCTNWLRLCNYLLNLLNCRYRLFVNFTINLLLNYCYYSKFIESSCVYFRINDAFFYFFGLLVVGNMDLAEILNSAFDQHKIMIYLHVINDSYLILMDIYTWIHAFFIMLVRYEFVSFYHL